MRNRLNTEQALAALIDPAKAYPVTYTIDHSGEKHHGATFLCGGDLTEKQIIDLHEKGLLKGAL